MDNRMFIEIVLQQAVVPCWVDSHGCVRIVCRQLFPCVFCPAVYDLIDRCAIEKSVCFDRLQAMGERYFSKSCTALESVPANAFHRTAEVQIRQSAEVCKGIVADPCHAGHNVYRGNVVLGICPWRIRSAFHV